MYSRILIKHFNSYRGDRGLCFQLMPKNIFYTKTHKISIYNASVIGRVKEGAAGGEGVVYQKLYIPVLLGRKNRLKSV